MDMKYIILLSCIMLVLFPMNNSAAKLSEIKQRIRREEIKAPAIDELAPRIRRDDDDNNSNIFRSLIGKWNITD